MAMLQSWRHFVTILFHIMVLISYGGYRRGRLPDWGTKLGYLLSSLVKECLFFNWLLDECVDRWSHHLLNRFRPPKSANRD